MQSLWHSAVNQVIKWNAERYQNALDGEHVSHKTDQARALIPLMASVARMRPTGQRTLLSR